MPLMLLSVVSRLIFLINHVMFCFVAQLCVVWQFLGMHMTRYSATDGTATQGIVTYR